MSPIQSEFSADWRAEPSAARPARWKRTFVRYLMTFTAGIVATMAWQSYGDAARQMIANSYPRLAWLAPAIAQTAPTTIVPPTASSDLAEVNQKIDQLATARQEIKMMSFGLAAVSQKVDQLAAAQEQMTREIAKLQAVEQYVLYKNPEPSPRPAPDVATIPPRNRAGR